MCAQQKANQLEKKLARAEETRDKAFRLERKKRLAASVAERERHEEAVVQRLEEDERVAEDRCEQYRQHFEAVVTRAENLKAEKELQLQQRGDVELQREMAAEQTRIENFQAMVDEKIQNHLERAEEAEKRRSKLYQQKVADRRLQLEHQKLRFETKRLLVERAHKADEYRVSKVADLIQRKDQQQARVLNAKRALRERRAQQARDFFVRRRQMADDQQKELQNLRFYGRVRTLLELFLCLHHAGIRTLCVTQHIYICIS
eukprot:SAG11_NODE_1098_length_5875_cov_3.667936_2_plen_260_part_00